MGKKDHGKRIGKRKLSIEDEKVKVKIEKKSEESSDDVTLKDLKESVLKKKSKEVASNGKQTLSKKLSLRKQTGVPDTIKESSDESGSDDNWEEVKEVET